MADQLPRWPNVERHVVAWLKAQTGRPIFTETRPSLSDHLPAYQVARIGGQDETEIGKRILVEVASVAAARGLMWDAVGEAESAMERLSASGTAEWYVDEVEETFSAAVEDTGNDGVRRASATYALTIRPR